MFIVLNHVIIRKIYFILIFVCIAALNGVKIIWNLLFFWHYHYTLLLTLFNLFWKVSVWKIMFFNWFEVGETIDIIHIEKRYIKKTWLLKSLNIRNILILTWILLDFQVILIYLAKRLCFPVFKHQEHWFVIINKETLYFFNDKAFNSFWFLPIITCDVYSFINSALLSVGQLFLPMLLILNGKIAV